jgi:hypothetical protein
MSCLLRLSTLFSAAYFELPVYTSAERAQIDCSHNPASESKPTLWKPLPISPSDRVGDLLNLLQLTNPGARDKWSKKRAFDKDEANLVLRKKSSSFRTVLVRGPEERTLVSACPHLELDGTAGLYFEVVPLRPWREYSF